MSDDLVTPEMEAAFDQRTHEHIDRVRKCLEWLAGQSPHAKELLERAAVHDASKFGVEERVPYIWLTEFHRCRRAGLPFAYPEGMEEKVRFAIRHHVTNNRHHAEFHTSPADMSEVDLIEMVCDWTAMAQEFGEDQGSARGWAKKRLGTSLVLDPWQCKLVYETIEALERG